MRQYSSVLALLLLAAACFGGAPNTATSAKSCEPTELDRRWTVSAPVYRSCEVDREAKPMGTAPTIKWMPPASTDRCNTALVEFVVDTMGVPEAQGARVVRATNPQFGLLQLQSVVARRYSAATKAGVAVRQVVREPAMMLVRFDRSEMGTSRDTLCKL